MSGEKRGLSVRGPVVAAVLRGDVCSPTRRRRIGDEWFRVEPDDATLPESAYDDPFGHVDTRARELGVQLSPTRWERPPYRADGSVTLEWPGIPAEAVEEMVVVHRRAPHR